MDHDDIAKPHAVPCLFTTIARRGPQLQPNSPVLGRVGRSRFGGTTTCQPVFRIIIVTAYWAGQMWLSLLEMVVAITSHGWPLGRRFRNCYAMWLATTAVDHK